MQKKHILILASISVICLFALLKLSGGRTAHADSEVTVSEIKQIARLNTVQAEEDFVFIDTIGNIGVVYVTTANININFDVDSLKFNESNDTLFVKMPQPSVSIHQTKEEFVTAFYTDSKVKLWSPDITPELSAEFHKNMEKKLFKKVCQGNLVKRASDNAKSNMKSLFSAFQKTIIIVDNF